MNGKERAVLRSAANKLDTIIQIGHNGVTDETIRTVDMALTAKELIKLRVLETSPLNAREAADILSGLTCSEIIHVIGYRFVLYRFNPEKHK